MRRGTTPTIKILLSNIDLDKIEKAIITIRQNGVIINADATVEDGYITALLKQNETLKLHPGLAEIQVKCKLENEGVVASEIKKRPIEDILNEDIL